MADEDFEYFSIQLKKARNNLDCRFFAYCLMTNHFHLLMRAESVSLSKAMCLILTAYARRFNLKFDRDGHVFQNRFGSIPCHSERYFLAILRYIHMNPVNAGMVKDPTAWRWSGHRELLGLVDEPLLDLEQIYARLGQNAEAARFEYTGLIGSPDSAWQVSDPSEVVGPSNQTIAEIGHLVAEETGIPLERITSPAKGGLVSQARRTIIAQASQAGWSMRKIARFLNCSPAAVSKAARQEVNT